MPNSSPSGSWWCSVPWGLLSLSFAATALGNSLEPISVLGALQPALLLHVFRNLLEGSLHNAAGGGPWRLAALGTVAATQALAWTVAFAGLFKMQGWTAAGLSIVFALGLLLWVPLSAAVMFAAVAFRSRFCEAPLHLLVFPCLWSAAYIVISATPLSSMTNPAYALLDYKPFALCASLLGVHGLNFMLALASTLAEDVYHSYSCASRPGHPSGSRSPKQRSAVALSLLLLLVYGSAWGNSRTFYQRDIDATAADKELTASCILDAGTPGGDLAWQLQQTAERVSASDDIILWSEAAVTVADAAHEDALLASAGALLRSGAGDTATSYLGVTYFVASDKRNMFVLLPPNASVAWSYQKAHPVPFQMDGIPGPAKLPIHDSAGIGRLGGAICFDMDFPAYLRQAGAAGVDILLQPSNTWGPIGNYHFRGNSLRAVENGFTHVRCSSGGYSGVATPFFDLVHHTASLSNRTLVFSVPVQGRVWTPYVAMGYLLEWVNLVAAVGLWAVLCTPAATLSRCCPLPLRRLLFGPSQATASSSSGTAAAGSEPLLPSLPLIGDV